VPVNSYNEVRQALEPVVGVPFKELAPVLGIDLPSDAARRKAAGGNVVETLLEIAKNSIPRPDLEALGTEVKTIPLNTLSRPREMTKIAAFNVQTTAHEEEFRYSSLYKKIRSILFVPIMKADNDAPDYWYLRPPFLWLPTEEQLDRMEEDYLEIQSAAAMGDWSRMTGMPGRFLTLNTSDSKTAGKPEDQKRRAWFLKKDMTREICEQHLWPRTAMEMRRELLAPRKGDEVGPIRRSDVERR
jgi:DNA mismatch repair protein MutH